KLQDGDGGSTEGVEAALEGGQVLEWGADGERHHLPEGVDPGVGPARAGGEHRGAQHRPQGILDGALDGRQFLLAGETVVRRAVIGDVQAVGGHRGQAAYSSMGDSSSSATPPSVAASSTGTGAAATVSSGSSWSRPWSRPARPRRRSRRRRRSSSAGLASGAAPSTISISTIGAASPLRGASLMMRV